MKNILTFALCLLALPALAQPQGPAMRSTNGSAFGATTHFRATSNYFAGKSLFVGPASMLNPTNRYNVPLTANFNKITVMDDGNSEPMIVFSPGAFAVTSTNFLIYNDGSGVWAPLYTGVGSGLTALNASSLSSGTIPDARFPATLPAVDGSLLTGINGPFTNTTTWGSAARTNYVTIDSNGLVSSNTSAAAQGVTISKGGITASSGITNDGNFVALGAATWRIIGNSGNDKIVDVGGRIDVSASGTASASFGSGGIVSPGSIHLKAAGSFGSAGDVIIDRLAAGDLRLGTNLFARGTITATNGFSSRSNVFTMMPTNASTGDFVLTASSASGHTRWAAAPGASSGIPTMTGWGTNTTLWFQTNNFHYIWVNGDDYSNDGGLQVGTANNYVITTPGNTGSFEVQGRLGATSLEVTNDATVGGTFTVTGGGSPNSFFYGDVSVPTNQVIAGNYAVYTNSNPVRIDFGPGMGANYFATNAAFAFLAPINVDTTKLTLQTTIISVTNSTAAAIAVTVPSTIHAVGTMFVTNVTKFTFTHDVHGTNCVALPIF